MPLWTRCHGVTSPSGVALLTLALLLLFTAAPCFADSYYRWQDDQGNHYYGDAPPLDALNAQPLQLLPGKPLYIVEKVIDGDTIRVKDGGKVRLLGINTPELARREHPAQPFAQEAHRRLDELLSGQRVYLEFDQQRRDRFGRLLAHVTREDGRRINEILLQEGLARALFLQPNMRHIQEYYRMERGAQQAKRGIWSLKEYRIRPATAATSCSRRFCRLRGRVKKVETKRDYTYLSLPGRLRVAIRNDQLDDFHQAGSNIRQLKGREVTVRGWIGTRNSTPYLKLQHPLQISLTPP